MRSLFLDTEFTCLSLDRRLISLALVGTQGDECYIELNEGWTVEGCSEFVQQVVLPQLDLARHGHSLEQARGVLVDFLQSQGEVEIVSDALAWDWPLLLELLGRDGLPATVRGCREDVQLLAGVDPQAIPHHALLDARLMAGLPLHSQAPYGME